MDYNVSNIISKMVSEPSELKKIYKSRNTDCHFRIVDDNLVEDLISKGWEETGVRRKHKAQLKIKKSHSRQFEDDIWCQLYQLGFKKLNFDDQLRIPYEYTFNGEKISDVQQIDILAEIDDVILVVECKSSEKRKSITSYKKEFELIGLKNDAIRKSILNIFGRDKKVKFVFATRNISFPIDSEDYNRLERAKVFYYNNNTFDYVNNIIRNYKDAAYYQFLGLVFKNELINDQKHNIPCIKSKMGSKDYFMFSATPELLLRIGFILHRTKANELDTPTYQRLLVPGRLKGIRKFIEGGGYFPNAIIINLDTRKHKIIFESASIDRSQASNVGVLKIPNAAGIAYIIDGQHRVYGYANSKFGASNSLPVVAFENLDTAEQLGIFMDINQNQKAVSPNLRLDLEEDLYWNSERFDSRLKALKSSIVKFMSSSESSPLFGMISVGEDKGKGLTSKPLYTALGSSGLLPIVRGNKVEQNEVNSSLYDLNNQNHSEEMIITKRRISEFLILSFDYVREYFPSIFDREKYFIVSNRGLFAYISILGSLNNFETSQGTLNINTKTTDRFNTIKKYIKILMEGIINSDEEDQAKQLSLLGAGADVKWFRFFQTIINKEFPNYSPSDFEVWKETENEELQESAKELSVKIERRIKDIVLYNLKSAFGDKWELEITSIKSDCNARALQEQERLYKMGENVEEIHWTEMIFINDYKTIIDKYWSSLIPKKEGILSFDKIFSIDIGKGFSNRAEKLKWLSIFNGYRNNMAHEGTKNKKLNKAEVENIEKIWAHLEAFDEGVYQVFGKI